MSFLPMPLSAPLPVIPSGADQRGSSSPEERTLPTALPIGAAPPQPPAEPGAEPGPTECRSNFLGTQTTGE